MSYEPEPLIVYERMFLFGASFLAAGAFVLDGHALLSGAHPTYAYVL